MKASLVIEAIGDDGDSLARINATNRRQRYPTRPDGQPRKRHWVAEITGRNADDFTYDRQFLRARRDYRQANGTGSRGVMAHYILETGRVYEVSAPISWKNTDRYFCRVTAGGDIERVSEEQVQEWISTRSE